MVKNSPPNAEGGGLVPGHRVKIPHVSWPKCKNRSAIVTNSIKTKKQFSSVTQSCPTLCNPMVCNTPGLPVHHQLLELTQTHVHRAGDAIQPSHPLLFPSSAFNLSQRQGLFQGINSSHQMTKVLECQLQHQSFQ